MERSGRRAKKGILKASPPQVTERSRVGIKRWVTSVQRQKQYRLLLLYLYLPIQVRQYNLRDQVHEQQTPSHA